MTHVTETLSPPSSRPRRGLRQWPLLVETLVTLVAASGAIRLLPFRRVVRIADRSGTPRRRRGDVPTLIWAVEALARRMPWRTVCFQKGLTLHLMLRRRGIASLLHYGVGRGDADELAAHVWVSVDGEIVQGGDVVDRFRCLATYPVTC